MDSNPLQRNLFGVHAAAPHLARNGIRLRQFGQQIIERLGGKRIHPAWIVPGGVSAPLSVANRDAILADLPEMLAIAQLTTESFKGLMEKFREEIASFGNFPSLFLASLRTTMVLRSMTERFELLIPRGTRLPKALIRPAMRR